MWDPITERYLDKPCWNGYHENSGPEDCKDCYCMCHDAEIEAQIKELEAASE
jgi:hypothetical protein